MGQFSDAVDAERQGRRDDIELSYWTIQPNHWTFQNRKVRRWCESWLNGRVLNACAGKTKLTGGFDVGEIVRNDINPEIDADTHVDICEIADHFDAKSFDTVVFDPPYSEYQSNKHYEGRTVGSAALAKQQFHELLRPGGRVIQFGYTTTCMPMELGYTRISVAVFNTLGQMHDILGVVDEKPSETDVFVSDFETETTDNYSTDTDRQEADR